MSNHSPTFQAPFTHLSPTFHVTEIGINPLDEKDLSGGSIQ